MGIKILIAVACQIPGEQTASHADVGDTAEVPKDDALLLCRMGRAFYLDKSDDPTKGTLTAGKDEQDSIKRQAKAIAAERDKRTTEQATATPAGMAAMVAAQVAAAVQAALKPATPA